MSVPGRPAPAGRLARNRLQGGLDPSRAFRPRNHAELLHQAQLVKNLPVFDHLSVSGA